MGKRNDKSKGSVQDYVIAAIAEDIEIANEYKDILARNNIPALTVTHRNYSSSTSRIAVMVPESMLEQAQEIIEERQQFDQFVDEAFNDYDDGLFEEEPDYFEDNEYFEDEEDV